MERIAASGRHGRFGQCSVAEARAANRALVVRQPVGWRTLVRDARHASMNIRALILVVCLLPGLLLPASAHLSLCLCASSDGVEGVEACAEMPCCAPSKANVEREGQWSSQPVCDGCKAIETPATPALEAPHEIQLTWVDPLPIDAQWLVPVEHDCGRAFAASPSASSTGPPRDRGILPLRI